MKTLIHIGKALLYPLFEGLLIAGLGAIWLLRLPRKAVINMNARRVKTLSRIKKSVSTTSIPLSTQYMDSRGGTATQRDYTVPGGVFRCSVPPAMPSKPQQNETSGLKYDEQKPRMALLSPKGLEEEAKGMTYGAKKYGDYNWRKGIAVSRYLSAALRHIFAVIGGEFIDAESGVHHLGLAKCNLGMALQTLEDHPELNDLYKRGSK